MLDRMDPRFTTRQGGSTVRAGHAVDHCLYFRFAGKVDALEDDAGTFRSRKNADMNGVAGVEANSFQSRLLVGWFVVEGCSSYASLKPREEALTHLGYPIRSLRILLRSGCVATLRERGPVGANPGAAEAQRSRASPRRAAARDIPTRYRPPQYHQSRRLSPLCAPHPPLGGDRRLPA